MARAAAVGGLRRAPGHLALRAAVLGFTCGPLVFGWVAALLSGLGLGPGIGVAVFAAYLSALAAVLLAVGSLAVSAGVNELWMKGD